MYTKPWLCGNSGFIDHRNKEILLSNLDTIYRDKKYFKENISVETGPAFLSDFKEMMILIHMR
jgi:hypothetical protein